MLFCLKISCGKQGFSISIHWNKSGKINDFESKFRMTLCIYYVITIYQQDSR